MASKHKSPASVDAFKSLSATLADNLAAHGVTLPHRSLLKVTANLLKQPNYQTVLALLKLNNPDAAPAKSPATLALDVDRRNDRAQIVSAGQPDRVAVTLSMDLVSKVMGCALEIAILQSSGADPKLPVCNLVETVLGSPLMAAYQAPTDPDSLETPAARATFMEKFGIEIEESRSGPGYVWRSPTDSCGDLIYATRSEAVNDAWETLYMGVIDYANLTGDQWRALSSAQQRDLVAKYFED